MALIYSTNVGTGGVYTARIYHDLISQNTSANFSYIRERISVQRNDGYNNSAYETAPVIYRNTKIDGGDTKGITASLDTRNQVEVFIVDNYHTVYHNPDGTKTIYISSYCDGISGTTYTAFTIGTSLSLPSIPRKSTCSFDNFTIGNDIAVNTNRATGSSFTHTLKLYINGTLILTKTDVGASITITPTSSEIDDMYNACPNTATPQAKIVCTTYSGTTNLGDTETIRIATVNPTLTPLFSNFVVADTNAITNALGTDFVKFFSNAKITISGGNKAVAQKYATISSYVITIGDFVKSYAYTDTFVETINNMANKIIIVNAVDSRGYSKTVSKIVPFLEYTTPSISEVYTERVNGIEETTYLGFKGNIWSGNFTNGANKVANFSYRVKNEGVWSSWFAITSNFNSKATITNGVITLEPSNELSIGKSGGSSGFDLGKFYDIEVKLTDGISTQLFNFIIGTASVNDGVILDSHYKDSNGEYHSGYHCMPSEDFNHNFCGTIGVNGIPMITYEILETWED